MSTRERKTFRPNDPLAAGLPDHHCVAITRTEPQLREDLTSTAYGCRFGPGCVENARRRSVLPGAVSQIRSSRSGKNMSCEILQNHRQNFAARRRLRADGTSFAKGPWIRYPIARKFAPPLVIGDSRKSWDLLWMLDKIGLTNTNKVVLDVGAFRSEILAILTTKGFGSAFGVDLAFPAHSPMGAKLLAADMMRTPFKANAFDYVTAVSVIEHGFDRRELLSEIARILRPGGSFLASFDYWPEKIDTSDTPLFGLPWNIFSRQEVEEFFLDARTHGLLAAGPISLDAAKRPILFENRRYTFGVLELVKQ